jgi:hypothetical protein
MRTLKARHYTEVPDDFGWVFVVIGAVALIL